MPCCWWLATPRGGDPRGDSRGDVAGRRRGDDLLRRLGAGRSHHDRVVRGGRVLLPGAPAAAGRRPRGRRRPRWRHPFRQQRRRPCRLVSLPRQRPDVGPGSRVPPPLRKTFYPGRRGAVLRPVFVRHQGPLTEPLHLPLCRIDRRRSHVFEARHLHLRHARPSRGRQPLPGRPARRRDARQAQPRPLAGDPRRSGLEGGRLGQRPGRRDHERRARPSRLAGDARRLAAHLPLVRQAGRLAKRQHAREPLDRRWYLVAVRLPRESREVRARGGLQRGVADAAPGAQHQGWPAHGDHAVWRRRLSARAGSFDRWRPHLDASRRPAPAQPLRAAEPDPPAGWRACRRPRPPWHVRLLRSRRRQPPLGVQRQARPLGP